MLSFIEKGYIVYVMAGFFLIGAVSKLAASLRYGRLRKLTENMPNTKDRFIKQMRGRFDNSFRMSGGIENISVFIDRQLRGYTYMGVSVYKWDRLVRKMMFLCLAVGGFAVGVGLYLQVSVNTLLWEGAASVSLVLAAWLFDHSSNSDLKLEQAKVNIRDYFENTSKHRLKNGVKESRDSNSSKQDIEYLKQNLNRIAATREPGSEEISAKGKSKLTEEDGKLIEEIIREYMT